MDLIEILIIIAGSSLVSSVTTRILGDFFSGKYIESIKNEHQIEIETLRMELLLYKENISRYSSKQFELYNSLYHSLFDLKEKADDLWTNATKTKLLAFSSQFKKTKIEVEKSYLFIETKHYSKIHMIFNQFSEYKLGKESILSLKKGSSNLEIGDHEIRSWIDYNEIRKKEYDILINEIREDLRCQIRGTDPEK